MPMDRAALVGAAASCGAGAMSLALGIVPPCPLHATTGLWCPLCGSTRATRALLHGQAATAVRNNPLIFATLTVLAWALVAWAFPRARVRVPIPLVWVAVAVLIAFGIARNLPGLAALAPPA